MQFADIDDLTVIANEIKKKANTTDLGTAAVADTTNSVTQGSGDLPTAGAVWTAIDNLPEPMIMKGTLGNNGTITALPTASADNEGFTYKVITAGTYAGQAAVVGDFFVSCKPEGASEYSWIWFPSGDESFSDTWRNIKVNGTEKLGTGISSGAVDFVDGTNTSVNFDTNGNKVSVSVPAVSSANAGVAPKGNAVSSQDQNTKFLREDGTWAKPSYTADTNTHRPIQVNDSQILGDNTTPLDLKAGSNVTISADGGNVTISAQDTTYSDATTSASGLMSASDKTKLDSVESGAQVNTVTGVKGNAETDYRTGNVNITSANIGLGNVDNTSDSTKKTNFTGSIADGNTGFITGGDVYTALQGKVNTETGKDLSENDFTDTLKDKLDGISANATKTESSSTNGHISIDDVDTTVYDDTAVQTAIDNIEDELSTDSATVQGNPLNFSTLTSQNAESTIIDLEPIQDLHGYDKPWVGGAGKNLLPLTVEGIKSANSGATWTGNSCVINNATFTILTDNDQNVIGIKVNDTVTSGAAYLILDLNFNSTENYNRYLNGLPSDGSVTTFQYRILSQNDWSSIQDITTNDTLIANNGTGLRLGLRIAKDYTANNLIFYPMIRLSTETDPTFSPYTNECPISGRTEVNLDGCGRNLWDGQYEIGEFDQTTGEPKGGAAYRTKNKISVIGNTSYYLMSSNTIRVFFYNKNVYLSNQTVNNGTTFTTPANTTHINFQTANTLDVSTFCLNKSDVNNGQYSPYTKSTDLTISFGQTVYGGSLDVENGVLSVVDAKNKISDLNWSQPMTTQTTGIYRMRTKSLRSTILIPASSTDLTDIMSDSYITIAAGETWREVQGIGIDAAGDIAIYDYRYNQSDSATAFVTAMGDSEIVYPLATPITINLTPHTINLLKGVNNISTDGDKITLTYRDGKFATLDGAVPKMTFRGEDYTMGVDDIGLFLKNLTKSTKTYITDPLLNFDGTVATYKKIMKQWFINNGVNIMDSTGITYLCERWYEITKQGWKGGTSFPAVGVSTGSTGTRFDDNVGMSVTPSTDTSANTDTYQGLPLFAITDCNWELDSDGNILITAIDGITDNFVRDDPTKFVGVMQQTGWVKKVDDVSTQKYYYADDKDAYEDLVPLPEAIKLDGTVRSFVVHAKYMSGIVDSKMTCCSGVIPRRNISHDSLVTLPDNIGTQYSGGTSVDWSFLVWMQRIKYASLTSDGVLQGCCNYNYQYYVKVSETGVKRLILSSANGANLKVGSTVTFGAYAGNADRGQADTYSISGQDGAIITAIEDVIIDSTTYKAIYVDTTSTFDTVANGDATNGTTIVSTHHWVSGSCDNVKGNDGSPVSATNGVYPAKLQGIEYMVGGYEVFADVIMNISGGYYNPYYARKSTDQATSITASMVQSTLKCAQPSSDAWRYIQKHGFDGEIFYPVSTGTSSSEYTKDGFYENGTGTTTGTREWLAFGTLFFGSGGAGLSCLRGSGGLAAGGWASLARLSPNGNRGELAA